MNVSDTNSAIFNYTNFTDFFYNNILEIIQNCTMDNFRQNLEKHALAIIGILSILLIVTSIHHVSDRIMRRLRMRRILHHAVAVLHDKPFIRPTALRPFLVRLMAET